MRDYAMIYRILCQDLRPYVRMRNHTGFAVRAQLRSFYKKLSPTGTISEEAKSKALIKFKAINDAISDKFVWVNEEDRDQLFEVYLKRYINQAFDFDMADDSVNLCVKDAHRWLGVGPGSSLKVDSESFYTKLFTGPISTTSAYALSLYRACICETGSWADAEMARSMRFGHTLCEGNSLFFVPKNVEIARTCCNEPLVNMILQKIAGGFIEDRLLKYFGISLSTQPDFNRELCRIGSVNGTFGTIDLKSASDSISWEMIKRYLPTYVVSWMSVARSPCSILPDGTRVNLKMISTMGNGFTFPLQTLLFAAVVRSVYHMHGLPCACPQTQYGVFGDDIIVARECYDDVVRYLTKLGFEVNDKKSFNTGPFRESCGYDYFNGYFVRAVYIQSLESSADVYSAINRLLEWSAVHGVDIPAIISYLKGLVRIRAIPPQESDDAGIKMPYFLAQLYGAKGTSYRKLKRVVRRRTVAETPEESRDLNYRDFNHDGWVTTILGGYARRGERSLNDGNYLERDSSHGFITLRDPPGAIARYRVSKEWVPYWNYFPSHASRVSYSRWEATVTGILLP